MRVSRIIKRKPKRVIINSPKSIHYFFNFKTKIFEAFKVICKNEECFQKIEQMIQDLIFKNYIIKNELNNNSVKFLNKDEVI